MSHWRFRRTLQAPSALQTQYGTARKTRHVLFRYLFMQDLVQNGLLKITKTSRDANPSDVFTKFPQLDMLKRHIPRIGIVAETASQNFYHQVIRRVFFNLTKRDPLQVPSSQQHGKHSTVLQRTSRPHLHSGNDKVVHVRISRGDRFIGMVVLPPQLLNLRPTHTNSWHLRMLVFISRCIHELHDARRI